MAQNNNQNLTSQIYPNPDDFDSNNQPKESVPASPKKNYTVLIIVLILLVVISVFGYFVYRNYLQPKSADNSQGNQSNQSNLSPNPVSGDQTIAYHKNTKEPWFSINMPQGWINDPSIDPEGDFPIILFPSKEERDKALKISTGDISDGIRYIDGRVIPSGLRDKKYIDEAGKSAQNNDASNIKPSTFGPVINKTLSKSKIVCDQIFYDVELTNRSMHNKEVMCGVLYQDNSQGDFTLFTDQTHYTEDLNILYDIIDSAKVIDKNLENYKNN